VISVLFTVLLPLILVGAGWTLLDRADTARTVYGGEKWLAAFILGSLLLYYSVFFSGFFLFSKQSSLAILVFLASMAVFSLRQMLSSLQDVTKPELALFHDKHLQFMWGTILLLMVLLLMQAFAPPNDYDSLNYHLAIPRNDIEQAVISPHWYKGVFAFFPALAEHHVRIALAVAGDGAAQAITWIFGLFLVLGTVLLVRRAGFGHKVAALAVIMLISVRGIVWEIATCYVEIQLAVFVVFAFLTYANWRQGRGPVWGWLFGVALAGGILVKYHGLVIPFCFLPLIIFDLLKRKINTSDLIKVIALCAVLLLPHMIRNFAYTGNPVFPIVNEFFNPDSRTFFSVDDDPYGRPRTILNYIRIMWDISILSTHLYDGAMIGAPYLLVFAPFAFFNRGKRLFPMAVVFFVYLAFWHWGMTRQVRFLIPVFPFLAAFAAVGVVQLLSVMTIRSRWIIVVAGSALLINQLLFIGIYALVRIPPAIGLISAEDYHAKTPTMNGAYFGACRYIEENLKKDESYISMLEPHSYYCPQSSAIVAPAFPEEARIYWLTGAPLKELSAVELATEMERRRVKFVVIETSREFRSGPSATPMVVQSNYATGPMERMGVHFQPIMKNIKPLFQDHNTSIYDAEEIIKLLQQVSSIQ
jgi:hypothetical protein